MIHSVFVHCLYQIIHCFLSLLSLTPPLCFQFYSFPPNCLTRYSSSLIEHTDKVIFLEDDDIAAVQDGLLTIHRLTRNTDESTTREVVTLQMELQQIMKGKTRLFDLIRSVWS